MEPKESKEPTKRVVPTPAKPPKGCKPFDLESAKNGASILSREGHKMEFVKATPGNPALDYKISLRDTVDGGEINCCENGCYVLISEGQSYYSGTDYDVFLEDPGYDPDHIDFGCHVGRSYPVVPPSTEVENPLPPPVKPEFPGGRQGMGNKEFIGIKRYIDEDSPTWPVW
jgi:hypothetical protein